MEERLDELDSIFTNWKIDERVDVLLRVYAGGREAAKMTGIEREVIEFVYSEMYPRPNRTDGRRRYYLHETLEIMTTEGLIQDSNNDPFTSYYLTAKGFRIHESGGWLKYVQQEATNQNLITEQIQSSIRTDKNIERVNNRQLMILYATILISALGLLVSGLNYYKPNAEEKKLYLLPSQSPLLSDTLQLLELKHHEWRCVHGNDTACCRVRMVGRDER